MEIESNDESNVKEPLDTEKTTRKNTEHSQKVLQSINAKPIINSVSPAISPITGTKLTITGRNFPPNIVVKISGVDINSKKVNFVDNNTLVIYSPPLEAGFKTVQIINPENNLMGELNDVLHYADDKSLTNNETHLPISRGSSTRRIFGKKDNDNNNDMKDHIFM